MSIIRFSCVKTELYAPDADGTFADGAYDKAALTGRIGAFDDASGPPADRAALDAHIDAMLAKAAPALSGPVTIMANGFQFDPRKPAGANPMKSDNPHAIIFHFRDGDETQEAYAHATGWPLWLGFEEGDGGANGLAVAFGWYSTPDFFGSLIKAQKNFYTEACAFAVITAAPFAMLIRRLAARIAKRPIDIVCHSLGSRLTIKAVLLALKQDPAIAARLGRIIILGGAEYSVAARKLVAALDGVAPPPEVYNFMGTSDAVLERLGQNFGPGEGGDHKVIGNAGLGLGGPVPCWIDLATGGAPLNDWLKPHGAYLVSDLPNQAADHWGYYAVRGNMKLFRRILRDRDAWAIADLRAAKIPEGR